MAAKRDAEYIPPGGSRRPAPLGAVPKVLATAAVWSIALVMGWRLRHPMADLALVGLAVAVTVVIWMHQEQGGA